MIKNIYYEIKTVCIYWILWHNYVFNENENNVHI